METRRKEERLREKMWERGKSNPCRNRDLNRESTRKRNSRETSRTIKWGDKQHTSSASRNSSRIKGSSPFVVVLRNMGGDRGRKGTKRHDRETGKYQVGVLKIMVDFIQSDVFFLSSLFLLFVAGGLGVEAQQPYWRLGRLQYKKRAINMCCYTPYVLCIIHAIRCCCCLLLVGSKHSEM